MANKSSKILITGANGMLGRACREEFRAHGWLAVPTDMKELDITDQAAVEEFVKREEPAALLNCAAFTDVDACEVKRELAYAVNAQGTANIARACEKYGALLVHVSTDYVFDGKKGSPYVETDKPNPVNYYAVTKRDSEEFAASLCPKNIIVRTSGLFGHGGKNFVATMIELFQKQKTLRVVNDQALKPTYSRALAEKIRACVDSRITGIIHCAGPDGLPWFDFANMILEEWKKFSPAAAANVIIEPVTSAEYTRPAKRPCSSILDTSRSDSIFGPMPPLRESVRKYIAEEFGQ